MGRETQITLIVRWMFVKHCGGNNLRKLRPELDSGANDDDDDDDGGDDDKGRISH